DPFTSLPDAAAAPVLTSTPPGVGQLGSLFDRIIPRGPTVTWPAGDVTLTLDLRETRPLRQIDFQVGQFGSYNTIAPAASLPAPRAVEAELSNDGFQADRRTRTLTFSADCTYENIHKGTVWPILRWTCAEVGGAARWVRLTFRAAAWPGALALNELSLRPGGASAVRAVGAVLRDVDGDGAAELLTWSDQAELAALKLDGKPLWRRRLPGFITAAEAYPDLGAGRRVLVTTREARLYCLDAAGNELWQTDFLESAKQNTDLPIGYSIGVLKAPDGEPVIVVGNYNLASFVSATGQVLRYQRLPGAFQTMTLSRGIDADGDGVEELVSSEVWGSFSALDGRLALKKGIRLPAGKGVALTYWGEPKAGAAKVLVCTESGVGRLDLGTLAYDWLHGLSPIDDVALGDFDGGGELQAAVAKHDGWVLVYDGRGELRRKVLVGEPVRALAAVPGAGGATLAAALPGRLVRLRGEAVATLAAGEYDRLLAAGPAGEVLALGPGGVVQKLAIPWT
ncbi:MAG: PQQ-binding-like beta-propeller repeat protein, partial [Armatimonadetes bacterium]|nr:PQQ-binding-like beta-propeller repeat protein [Armatimonadota bacterium]